MGTLNHPGIFDCPLTKLAPGEPFFVLAGRDSLAADLVEVWAIRAKCHGCNHDKTREAMHIADEMREWRHRPLLALITHPAECERDEPFFVLRGRDSLAADLVETWLKRAVDVGYSSDVITAAATVWRSMVDYPNQKNPD